MLPGHPLDKKYPHEGNCIFAEYAFVHLREIVGAKNIRCRFVEPFLDILKEQEPPLKTFVGL